MSSSSSPSSFSDPSSLETLSSSSFENTASAVTNCFVKPRIEASLCSDGQNLRYFNLGASGGGDGGVVVVGGGNTSDDDSAATGGISNVPIMLDCPKSKLRIMPYATATQVGELLLPCYFCLDCSHVT